MPEKIERDALAGQNGRSGSIDFCEKRARLDLVTVTLAGAKGNALIEQLECTRCAGKTGDGTGLARDKLRARFRASRNGCRRRDIAGTAEILVECPANRVFDCERRKEGAGGE